MIRMETTWKGGNKGMTETYEQQKKDSDMIFTAISTSAIDNFKDAERMVVIGYVTDMSVSRSGISHALKKLEQFYNKNNHGKASL